MVLTLKTLTAYRLLGQSIEALLISYSRSDVESIIENVMSRKTDGVYELHNKMNDVDVNMFLMNAGE